MKKYSVINYWEYTNPKEYCKICNSHLKEQYDIFPCEDCGHHPAHACLTCMQYWDAIYDNPERETIDE